MVWERLRKYIDDNGMMMSFIAKRANIGAGRFYRLMNGRAPLLVDEYETICRNGLQVDPGLFFRPEHLI